MTDADTTPRRGRRARELSPEESAALESRTAAVVTGEMSPVPGARGAVAAPEADAAVPTLRKFGRRARIIELSDPGDEQTAGLGATDADQSADGPQSADEAQPADADQASGGAESAESPGDADVPAEDGVAHRGDADSTAPAPESAPAAPRPARRTANVDRDRDGVELGELPVSEAPDPRPAPRFDGKVLHRPERSGGRPLLWIVWVLIAVAVIVLVALMLSGVLGSDTAALAASLDIAVIDLSAPYDTRLPLEEAAA